MKSIKEIYKIGMGPSSSHTMGPRKAAEIFAAENPGADEFIVTLYGSLAKTGRGHRTDAAVTEAFAPRPCSIVFDEETTDLPHANTLDFCAIKAGNEISRARVLSVGGGDIEFVGRPKITPTDVYPHSTFDEIADFCTLNKIKLSEYAERFEGAEIREFLKDVWHAMMREIDEGLSATGILPGGLNVERKAKFLYNQAPRNESETNRENRIVCSYAFATGEQNADLGIVVTAPTCGACAVVPAVLRYAAEKYGFSEKKIVSALAVGGLIGCIIKENASISGAECGCQAEIGSACSMAAAALCELFDMDSAQIEYAAEVAMEHYLGLTCDPICGLVQIPCIERNAVAAMRAINCLSLATFLTDTSKISFDFVVKTMYETGKDIPKRYRETAEGGLA
ncbi:MAG: L-serine ammonia-lyase, iron-sulfur-dependent, subunit alpha, partial [Clostridia bacterium]|nr:L-serine ammonia-lyase, iron-sulfur-dependent, subunit alpha [Clostridia bacterium]